MGEETARLREEIDRTRDDLTRDVNRLADKTSPGRIVERRVQRTRGRLVSLKEKVMGSSDAPRHVSYAPTYTDEEYGVSYTGSGYASGYGTSGAEDWGSRLESTRQTTAQATTRAVDTARDGLGSARDSVSHAGGRASEAAHGAVTNVREETEGNPLAAGLVAFGVGWLASSLLPASAVETQAAQRAGEVAREHGGPVLEQAKQSATEVGQELKSHAQDAAAQVKETTQQAVSEVKDTAQEHAAEVKDAAQDHAQAARAEVRSSTSG